MAVDWLLWLSVGSEKTIRQAKRRMFTVALLCSQKMIFPVVHIFGGLLERLKMKSEVEFCC